MTSSYTDELSVGYQEKEFIHRKGGQILKLAAKGSGGTSVNYV